MSMLIPAWIICAVAAGALVPQTEVTFDELRKSPAKFNLQSVTMVALVEVDGGDIRLWRDVAMRHREEWMKTIRVYPDLSAPRYPGTDYIGEIAANLRWCRVTGVVDTSIHGRFGNEPFGILLQHLEILPYPRLKQFLRTLAWFRNETDAEVELRTTGTTKAGGTLQSFIPLGAGELTFNSIEWANNRVALSFAGKKASPQRDLLPRGSRRYYDAEKRAYYFRIVKGAIQPVLPSKVGDWEFFPTPDRD